MNRYHAFSRIEILMTVSLIALPATVGSVTYGSLSKSSKSVKINSDVAALNRASPPHCFGWFIERGILGGRCSDQAESGIHEFQSTARHG